MILVSFKLRRRTAGEVRRPRHTRGIQRRSGVVLALRDAATMELGLLPPRSSMDGRGRVGTRGRPSPVLGVRFGPLEGAAARDRRIIRRSADDLCVVPAGSCLGARSPRRPPPPQRPRRRSARFLMGPALRPAAARERPPSSPFATLERDRAPLPQIGQGFSSSSHSQASSRSTQPTLHSREKPSPISSQAAGISHESPSRAM